MKKNILFITGKLAENNLKNILERIDNKDIFININRETDLLEYKELIDKNFKSYE